MGVVGKNWNRKTIQASGTQNAGSNKNNNAAVDCDALVRLPDGICHMRGARYVLCARLPSAYAAFPAALRISASFGISWLSISTLPSQMVVSTAAPLHA